MCIQPRFYIHYLRGVEGGNCEQQRNLALSEDALLALGLLGTLLYNRSQEMPHRQHPVLTHPCIAWGAFGGQSKG